MSTLRIRRSASGAIVAVSRPGEAAGAGWEDASADDPELIAFLRAIAGEEHPLDASDLPLVRVLEDLIEVLIERAVIRVTDLPPAAQAKLSERRGKRSALQGLRLLDESDGL